MRILGLDVSIACTGYGVLQIGNQLQLLEGGTIKTKPKDPMPVRLAEIIEGVTSVITDFRPDRIALEDVWINLEYPETAIKLARAQGAIMGAVGCSGIPFSFYAPAKVKKAATWYGQADKAQMVRAMESLFRCEGMLVHDAADGIAVALTDYYATLRPELEPRCIDPSSPTSARRSPTNSKR